jgi:hypothetical protein
MDFSILEDLSSDGRIILFSEEGAGGGPGYAVYIRPTDGAPAVRLGKGDALALSSDGAWALATDLATHTLKLFVGSISSGRPQHRVRRCGQDRCEPDLRSEPRQPDAAPHHT